MITSTERSRGGRYIEVDFLGSMLSGYSFVVTEWNKGEMSGWSNISETVTGILDQIQAKYGQRPSVVSNGRIHMTIK